VAEVIYVLSGIIHPIGVKAKITHVWDAPQTEIKLNKYLFKAHRLTIHLNDPNSLASQQ
jgi:hypothetical protein